MPYHDALPDDWLQPGETTVVEVDGFPIAVGNVDGEHFAFRHLCPTKARRSVVDPWRTAAKSCARSTPAAMTFVPGPASRGRRAMASRRT